MPNHGARHLPTAYIGNVKQQGGVNSPSTDQLCQVVPALRLCNCLIGATSTGHKTLGSAVAVTSDCSERDGRLFLFAQMYATIQLNRVLQLVLET